MLTVCKRCLATYFATLCALLRRKCILLHNNKFFRAFAPLDAKYTHDIVSVNKVAKLLSIAFKIASSAPLLVVKVTGFRTFIDL
jgi:hypothetical protein